MHTLFHGGVAAPRSIENRAANYQGLELDYQMITSRELLPVVCVSSSCIQVPRYQLITLETCFEHADCHQLSASATTFDHTDAPYRHATVLSNLSATCMHQPAASRSAAKRDLSHGLEVNGIPCLTGAHGFEAPQDYLMAAAKLSTYQHDP
jgi:hypothetical protein